jgi:hypothetical protein
MGTKQHSNCTGQQEAVSKDAFHPQSLYFLQLLMLLQLASSNVVK